MLLKATTVMVCQPRLGLRCEGGGRGGDTLVLVDIKHNIWFPGVDGIFKRLDRKVQGVCWLSIAWHLKDGTDGDGLCSQGVPGRSSNNASVNDRTEPASASGGILQVLHGHVDDGGVAFGFRLDCPGTTLGVQGTAVAVGEIVVLGRHSPSRGGMAHILNVVGDVLIWSGWFAEMMVDLFVREASWVLGGGDLARNMRLDEAHGFVLKHAGNPKRC